MAGWTRRGSALLCALLLASCEDLVGADFDGFHGRTDASAGHGGLSGIGGAGASSGRGGTIGSNESDAAGSGGSTETDAGSPDAGDAADGGPSRWVLQGAFVGGTIVGKNEGLRLRARFVWHGQIQGAAGGYQVEGWLR